MNRRCLPWAAVLIAVWVCPPLDGLALAVKKRRAPGTGGQVPAVVFAVPPEARSTFTGGRASRPGLPGPFTTASVEVRNTGVNSVGPGYLWTLRRIYPLLGHTLPERQIYDLLAGTALLRQDSATGQLALFGQRETALLPLYAALLDPRVGDVILDSPPESHTQPATPELLGVLRTGDLPQNRALLYPRPITFVGQIPPAYEWTRKVYEKLGATERIRVIRHVRDWRPALVE